ncbi:Methionyl-tRNA formyltransferase [Pseudomonas fluorescens]|nr:Methionyl-tRNA formyltransferase [Pseudomonas fluorescens]
MMIERFISDCASTLHTPANPDAYFDTASVLRATAQTIVWGDEEYRAMEFLSKRVEISRCLYESYREGGARTSTNSLADALQPLALALLFKDFGRLSNSRDTPNAVKRLNGVLKLLDTLTTKSVTLDPALVSLIKTQAQQFLATLQPVAPPPPTISNTIAPLAPRTLPLTVLFWEGPIARAYLATLKSMGLKPDKIIHLVSKNDLVTKKPIGRFVPKYFKLVYAQSRQKNSIHYWSSTLQKNETTLYRAMRSTVENGLKFPASVIDDALALVDLNEYSPHIETLMIENLSDNVLHDHLSKLQQTQILFTGGGIVPKKLLEIPTLKFIHIHPGHLPEVRGADCVLWSNLMKGRTSATCFYMAPGIDDGDVILASYLPPLTPRLHIAQRDVKTLYRATYAFFDPWVRGFVLRQALIETDGFTRISATPQVEDTSVTYHFMHAQIQHAAFSKLFADI